MDNYANKHVKKIVSMLESAMKTTQQRNVGSSN